MEVLDDRRVESSPALLDYSEAMFALHGGGDMVKEPERSYRLIERALGGGR